MRKFTSLTPFQIGQFVRHTGGEIGKIKSFDNELQRAFVVFNCNGNWNEDQWKDYTAESTKYSDLRY